MVAMKGEARFDHGGQAYTMRFDFAALCEIEELLDKPIKDVMAELQGGNPRMKTIASIVLGGLRGNHPDVGLNEVGQLLVDAPDVVISAMNRAISGSAPADREGGAKSNPRKPRRNPGIGARP